MKKLFPLLLLVILFSSLPFVNAESESLYVDSYTGDLANWDERNAPSPYLADESIGYVHEVKSSGATEGYFGFADPSGTGTINSVTLYLTCYGEDTNDKIYIYVDCSDGSGWVNEGTIFVNQLSYDWETLSLTTRLDSWTDIQNAQIYLFYQGVGGGDDIFVRRAFLYVDYTPSSGTEYTREVSQYLSWTGISYRSWNTSRLLTQSTILATTVSRNWDLSRTLTQGLSFLSSAIGQIITGAEQFLRTVTIGLSITTDSLRSWTLSRTFTQGISFVNNAIGQKLLGNLIKRFVTLSMNFTSNIAVYTTIINEFNIELGIFALLGIFFTAWGWSQKVIIPLLVGTIFWFCSAWWWWVSDTSLPHLALAFSAVGIINILKFFESTAGKIRQIVTGEEMEDEYYE